ncbi:MAG TPA: ankyrin repeat domain-containing protein [Candidatus Paceibacterota bacterium]|nr:ankyrin repeat domain-containing protein [Candidatus Paceibacterota bacterium]
MKKIITLGGIAMLTIVGYLLIADQRAMSGYHETKRIEGGKVLSYGDFTISVPKDWSDVSNKWNTIILLSEHDGDPDNGYRPNVVIERLDGGLFTSLDGVARKVLGDLRDLYGETFNVIQEEKVAVAGHKAVQRVYDFNHENEGKTHPLRQMQTYLEYKGIVYVITVTHTQKSFNDYRPKFEAIMETLDTNPLASSDPNVRLLNLVIEGQNEVYAIGTSQNRSLLGVFAKNDKRNIEVALKAIRDGADVNTQAFFGETPLVWAASKGYVEVVRPLIERGADVAGIAEGGRTALRAAVRGGNEEILGLLLESGKITPEYINTPADTEKGETLLMEAVEKGDLPLVKKLIEVGAAVDKQDINGRTALSVSARNAEMQISAYLLEQGADVNLKTNDGETALFGVANWYSYEAKNNDQVAFARMLLDNGADPKAKNKDGKTAAEVARDSGYFDLAEFLDSY